MIRVLHLRQSCGLYGADRALLDLAEATRSPFEAVVGSIVRAGRDDPFGGEAKRRGLPLVSIVGRGKADLGAARQVVSFARDHGIGVLHAHDYKGLTLAALAAPRLGIPVVATFHGDTGATPALVAYEALARVLGNLTRGVAAVSEPLERRLRRWVRFAPVHRIANGIRVPEPCTEAERAEARAELGLPIQQQVVSSIGRLSAEKGHAVLLRALVRMERRPVLLVAGEGPLERELRSYAEAHRLDVRWLGFVRDTRRVYAASDAVVMPSLTEGLPLVGLEAMSLARPLVASSVGELPRMLDAGAGVLVPPGDDEALAAGLQTVLMSEDERRAMAEQSRRRAQEHYALEQMADRYARLLYAPATSRVREDGWQLGTG